MLATSPEATSITSCTFIQSAFALDEITQRLAQILVYCCVPQRSRPFAPRSIIDLVWICRAKDHGGVRLCLDGFDAPDEFVLLLSSDGVVRGKHVQGGLAARP
jgi:hypothetical protein